MRTQCFQMNWADTVPPNKHVSSRPGHQRQGMGMESLPCCGGVWLSTRPFLCSLAAVSPPRVCGLASPGAFRNLAVETGLWTQTLFRGPRRGKRQGYHCHDPGGLLNHQVLTEHSKNITKQSASIVLLFKQEVLLLFIYFFSIRKPGSICDGKYRKAQSKQ